MEFGYRAVFIAVPPSVRSYVNRDTNAWKRKGLTDEKAREGGSFARSKRDRHRVSVTLKIEKNEGRGKREREREIGGAACVNR